MNLTEVVRRLGPIPAAVCELADKKVLLCGCQAGPRQEGVAGNWSGACWLSEANAHIASSLGGRDSCSPRLGSQRLGMERAEAQASRDHRAQSRGPGSLAVEAVAPGFHSREPPGPVVKLSELFTRAQLSLPVGKGGRAPRPSSEKLDTTWGGCGQQWAVAMTGCRGAGRLDCLQRWGCC